MSSFIEFQAIVFDKLSAIENRLINIENTLGISCDKHEPENVEKISTEPVESKNEKKDVLKKELSAFQDELSDIKNLFASSDK